MCRAVYIGSDAPLPMTEPWSDEAQTFYVRKLNDEEEAKVRGSLGTPNIVYAGSHEKCGCGFEYGGYVSIGTPEEERAHHRSLALLRDYLAAALKSGPVDLYACWIGDEGKPTTDSAQNVTLDFFGGGSFTFTCHYDGSVVLHVVAG